MGTTCGNTQRFGGANDMPTEKQRVTAIANLTHGNEKAMATTRRKSRAGEPTTTGTHTTKKATTKKSAAKKSTVKKTTAKKSTAKKTTAKKSVAKKTTAKKTTRKTAVRKAKA